jgi:C_GCAxxG_C_C family probable redox protein
LQETFGLRDEGSFKAAAGLHGGIGGRQDVCGALLGASLMLGLMFGSSVEESGKPKTPPSPGELDLPTQLVGELYKWFKKEFGSVKCRSIQVRHTKEINAQPDAAGLTDMERMQRMFKKCDQVSGKTAAHTVEMIWDEIKPGKKKTARKQAGDH